MTNRLYLKLAIAFLASSSIVVTVQAARILARQRPIDRPALAITHVTVIEMTSGSSRPDMTVLVRGDRIAEVANSGNVSVPDGATVVDGRGKVLVPGLWDMHVHVFNGKDQGGTNNSEYAFPLLVANGVVGIRDMRTDPEDIVQALQWNREIGAGRLVAPRVMVTSSILDGERTGPAGDALVVHNPDEGRAAVRSLAAAGAKLIKVYWDLSRESFFAIADEARHQGIPFGGHVPRRVNPGEASDAGQYTIEHMDGLYAACSKQDDATVSTNERAVLTGVYDAGRCDALVDRLRRNGTWLVPTSVVFWDAADADVAGRQSFVPPLAGTGSRRQSPPKLVVDVHRTMRRVGRFLSGTDISIRRSALAPGISLHDELALFVEMGFTPAEALQAATINPAKYAGLLAEFGTIEPNKRADLVLLDADPLANIRNASRISAVVLNGRFLDRADLDHLRAQGAAAVKSLQTQSPLSLVIRSADGASGFAGTWMTDFPAGQHIVADLTVAGTKVTGTIEAPGQSIPVFDGTVNGDDITFKFSAGDSERTITLTGRLRGDEIAFTRSVEVRPGGRPGGAGFFGGRNTRTAFTARRTG